MSSNNGNNGNDISVSSDDVIAEALQNGAFDHADMVLTCEVHNGLMCLKDDGKTGEDLWGGLMAHIVSCLPGTPDNSSILLAGLLARLAIEKWGSEDA